MLFGNQDEQLSAVLKQRNIAFLGLAGALLVIILQSLVLFFQSRTVVVTPSVIAREYIISGNRLSKSYLEDMSRDVITTLLDITPGNVQYMSQAVLKMVHPASYGEVKRELLSLQEDVITRKVSTVFYPTMMSVDEKSLTVQVEGDFSTFVGATLTNTRKRTFQISYIYTGAKLTIGSFSEIIQETKPEAKK